MRVKVLLALIIGIIAAGSTYYVWCSLQWREAARQKKAETEVSAVETYAEPGETAAIEGGDPAAEQHATSTATPATAAPGARVVAADSIPTSPATPTSRIEVPGTVALDARLGHGAILPGGETRMHVSLTLTGSTDAAASGARPPANIVLVVDRSGSMKGDRMRNAKAAAQFLIGQLEDGDRVSIVSYNTKATVDQQMVAINATNRSAVVSAIDNIKLGGDTCISCGILQAREQLLVGRAAFLGEGKDPVSRVILLSDGKATSGVRDTASLAQMARETVTNGGPVTTIGVGLDYNEDLMTEVAMRGTGNHYFVESPSALQSTLASELGDLRDVVARNVLASLQLAPGVRLVKVFDRDSQQFGNGVTVDVGDVSAGKEATVLAELAISPGLAELVQPVTDVSVNFNEASTGLPQRSEASLETLVTRDANAVMLSVDDDVEARVEQVAIREALALANAQVRAGQVEEARQTIRNQATASQGWRRRGGGKSRKAKKSMRLLDKAEDSLASPFESADDASRAMKSNSAGAFDLMQ